VAKKEEPEAERRNSGREGADLTDQRLTEALVHPMRVRILALANQRPISPSEFSEELGLPLSRVSYHFRVLDGFGLIELARERSGCGSSEHFYRGARRAVVSDADWEPLGEAVQAGVSLATLQDFNARVREAMAAGTFDAKEDSHFTWTAMSLDQQGWRDLVAVMATAYREALGIEVEAVERMARSGEEPMPATFAVAGFESPKEKKGRKRKR
jgi:DNA-binding transcriptional ArsR family regulator